MGLFGGNTKKLIQEFRRNSEYYSDDLSREIREMLDELRSEHEETGNVVSEFASYIKDLSTNIEKKDALMLEEFSRKIARLNRTAEKGVDAMRQLSKDQRKLTAENLRDVDALQYIH